MKNDTYKNIFLHSNMFLYKLFLSILSLQIFDYRILDALKLSDLLFWRVKVRIGKYNVVSTPPHRLNTIISTCYRYVSDSTVWLNQNKSLYSLHLARYFHSFFNFDKSNRIIKYQKSANLVSFYSTKHLFRQVRDLISIKKHLLCHTFYKNYRTKHLLCNVHDKINYIKQLLCHTSYKINTVKQSLCHILETRIDAKQILRHSYFLFYDTKHFICPVYDLNCSTNGFIHHIFDLKMSIDNRIIQTSKPRGSLK